MYKETITYTDYNGTERSEDFYFNLSKAELIEMELGGDKGSMSGMLDRIVRAKDTPDIIREIKSLLLKSYGVKTPDGRSFIKPKEAIDAFEHSEPFSIMFMRLATDDEAAAKFVTGIMPKDVLDQIPAGSIPLQLPDVPAAAMPVTPMTQFNSPT